MHHDSSWLWRHIPSHCQSRTLCSGPVANRCRVRIVCTCFFRDSACFPSFHHLLHLVLTSLFRYLTIIGPSLKGLLQMSMLSDGSRLVSFGQCCPFYKCFISSGLVILQKFCTLQSHQTAFKETFEVIIRTTRNPDPNHLKRNNSKSKIRNLLRRSSKYCFREFAKEFLEKTGTIKLQVPRTWTST